MNDNDVIKALEYCLGENAMCELCPYDKHSYRSCMDNLLGDTLDLINRQKDDINRVTVELQAMRGAANSYKMHYEKAQAEIEELKKKMTQEGDTSDA